MPSAHLENHGDKGQRTIIYIPIIHSQVDMGELSNVIKQVTLKKLGVSEWSRKANLIEQYWNKIDTFIDTRKISFDRTRIYQDGLPVCGREGEIVRELAEKGSHNHKILVKLMDRGAVLMGTESPELLIEEYRIIVGNLGPGKTASREPQPNLKEAGLSILHRRDEFIADRIDGTLLEGETGFLFLGALHKAVEMLPKDINLVRPMDQYIEYRGA